MGREACDVRRALSSGTGCSQLKSRWHSLRGLWKVRGRRDECLCSLSLDDRLFAQVQVCLFKKFEDEDRARLSWIGVDLKAGAGVGVEGGQGRGAPKVHLTTWATGQGSVLRTFHSWCAKGRGLEGNC